MRRPEAQTTPDIFDPIPLNLPGVAGWKEVPLQENHEPLVALGPFSENDDIFTSSIYAAEHSNSPYWRSDRQLAGSLVTQFVRAEVAEQIRTAQSLLPERHYLLVLDSYRSLDVQGALYGHYQKSLAAQHPDWDLERLSAETQKYVSIPSHDPSRPSPHNTGGAVDLAIFTLPAAEAERLKAIESRLVVLRSHAPKDFGPEEEAYNPILRELYLQEMTKISLMRRYGQMLDFGTPFDYGGEVAASNYLEQQGQQRQLSEAELRARDNRRLLYGVMATAGMQAYSDEWWHFNAAKSQMGAKAAGLDHAEYGGVQLSPENQEHETMRSMHHVGTVRIQEARMVGARYRGKNATLNTLTGLNEDVLTVTGDPRLTFLAKADIIEPPAA